ncbi:hypothetical protein H6F77_22990 [Microcoleus sp. FACHB-831]|uniref:hypothetical protein n=1 Tax=Microcoleus sp. FACHB-831 TaxID=2692827 RepID=UPI001686DCA8|nr:hypothetical protein [Microcoleus sp. FACHB-831]MBD1923910.1 hypothetical protein [Microcoleus sp. FACHB-831]
MRNYFSISSRQDLNLEEYIKIEEVKDEQKRVQSRFIRFNLHPTVLDRILLAKATGRGLYIPRHLLAALRSYALLDAESRLQSGLTFCSYYYQPVSQHLAAETIVMRSVIALDGDVIHQIRRDCLENGERCRAIATAHYWLISQLLNSLRLKTYLLLSWLSWGLSLLIVAATIISKLDEFWLLHPFLQLATVLLLWLLQEILRRLLLLLLPSLGRWALRFLLRWMLSYNSTKRTIALGILARFVP